MKKEKRLADLFIFFLALFLCFSVVGEAFAAAPTVRTDPATNIYGTGATLNGRILSNGGAPIINHGFQWGTSSTNLSNNVFLGAMANIGAFSRAIGNLTPGTTYYYRAFASNSAGTSYGTTVLSFTTLSRPSVTTNPATNIYGTGATFNGSITSNGGAPIINHGFQWGTSPSNVSSNVFLGAMTNIGAFSRAIGNLTPGTTYYYRAFASNSVGDSFGAVVSFTTLSFPSVTTNQATSISTTGATFNGNITSNGGAPIIDHGFQWGSSSTNLSSNVLLGAKTGNLGAFSRAISNLTPGATYYYRTFAANTVGNSYGDVVSFKTPEMNILPTSVAISPKPVSLAIGETQQLSATVLPSNAADKTVTWSSNNTAVAIVSASGLVTARADGTAVITVKTNTAEKTDTCNVIVTPNASLTVITDPATNIYGTGATLNGRITSSGGTTIINYGFQWGTSSNNLSNNVFLGGMSNIGAFSRAIGNLTPGATYYYRAFAANSAGTAYGAVVSFRTLSLPSVTTNQATNISARGATFNGNITSSGGAPIIDHGFQWGASSSNLSSNVLLGAIDGNAGAFSRAISNLTPDATYYYRAYAANSAGTSYGAVVSFKTNDSEDLLTAEECLKKMEFKINDVNGVYKARLASAVILFQYYKYNSDPTKITGIIPSVYPNELLKDLNEECNKNTTYGSILRDISSRRFSDSYFKYYNYKYNGDMPIAGLPSSLPGENSVERCSAAVAVAWARMYQAAINDSSISSSLKDNLLVNVGYRRIGSDIYDVNSQKWFYCIEGGQVRNTAGFLYRRHDPSLTAYPGSSNHGWGYALDLNLDGPDGMVTKWLQNNASSFELRPYDREFWHYDLSYIIDPQGNGGVRQPADQENYPRPAKYKDDKAELIKTDNGSYYIFFCQFCDKLVTSLDYRFTTQSNYTINAFVTSDGGTITGDVDGDIVTLSVTPNEGYIFDGFYEDGALISESNSTTFKFTATEDRNIEARFESINAEIRDRGNRSGGGGGGCSGNAYYAFILLGAIPFVLNNKRK